jgi:hypothetical protein
MEQDGSSSGPQHNRFFPRTQKVGYSNKTEYLKALSAHITPEVWDLIVARAIQDATLGKPQQRAKARDWLAKHVLPLKTEGDLQREPRADYDLLVRVYRLFEKGIDNEADVVSALAATFGSLLPRERAILRSAILAADSEEIQGFWVDAREIIRNGKNDIP